jgi:hypothetical protein
MSSRCERLLDARGMSFLRKSAWLLIILLAVSSPAAACTSFAVWSDQVWYGMNFDYYSTTPFLVSIVEEGGSELFLMAYLLRNIYVPTVGIDQVRNVL